MRHDGTLIRVRERAPLDLLDLALVVVRRRPWAVGLAALAGTAPFAALNAWLAADGKLSVLAFVPLLAVEAPWATAPLTVVLGGLMFGDRPPRGAVVRALIRGLPAMAVYQLLARAALVVSVVFYPLVPARLAFVNEVILLERGPVSAVARRSSTLCTRRGGDFFWRWAAQVLFGGLFVVCFWFGTGSVVNALTTSELTWDRPGPGDFHGPRFQLGVWLAVSFFGVARFLAYIDQRTRLEGWELKLRLEAVGRSLGGASRW